MLPHKHSHAEMVTQLRRPHLTDEKTEAWGSEWTYLDMAGTNACQTASVAHREPSAKTDPQ